MRVLNFSLINSDSPSSRPAPQQGSVGASAIRVTSVVAEPSLWQFCFPCRKFISLKDEWAVTYISSHLEVYMLSVNSWWNNCGWKFCSVENNLEELPWSRGSQGSGPSVGLAECLATHWSEFRT